MPTKPASLMKWATSALGITRTTTTPSQTLLDGWYPGQKPPAQWWNDRWNLLGKWIDWLDALEATAHAWSALQTFSAGIAGTTLNFSGDGDVGGTLGVGGDLGVSGGAQVDGDALFQSDVHVGDDDDVGTLTVGPDISLDALTGAAAFANATVTGTLTKPVPSHSGLSLASGVSGISGAKAMSYWTDVDGAVHLEGSVQHTSSAGWDVGTLPVGSRPSASSYGVCATGATSFGVVTIATTGLVSVAAGGAFSEAHIHITFKKNIAASP